MEVTLDAKLEAYARFFQQIVDNRCRVEHSSGVEVDLDKLAETRRVIVLERLGVAKCLKEWVRVQHLLFDRRAALIILSLFCLLLSWLFILQIFLGATETFASACQVGQYNLGRLGLAGS